VRRSCQIPGPMARAIALIASAALAPGVLVQAGWPVLFPLGAEDGVTVAAISR
jgi:hypothetical protein